MEEKVGMKEVVEMEEEKEVEMVEGATEEEKGVDMVAVNKAETKVVMKELGVAKVVKMVAKEEMVDLEY